MRQSSLKYTKNEDLKKPWYHNKINQPIKLNALFNNLGIPEKLFLHQLKMKNNVEEATVAANVHH